MVTAKNGQKGATSIANKRNSSVEGDSNVQMTKKVLSDEKRLLKANHDKTQQHKNYSRLNMDMINMKELNSVSFKRDMRPADMEKYGIYSLAQMQNSKPKATMMNIPSTGC